MTPEAKKKPVKGIEQVPHHKLGPYITAPSTIGGVVGVVLALAYAYVTVEVPQGTWVSLLVIIGAVVPLMVISGDRWEQSTLPTLRSLAKAMPNRDQLIRAARETARLPDVSFRVNAGFWMLGAVLVGIGYGLLPKTPLNVAGRILFIGVSLGPLVGMLAYISVVSRARRVLERLMEIGLKPNDVVAAIPPDSLRLGARLTVYAAVAIGTPLALVVDLSVRRIEQLLNQLAAAPDSAARLDVSANAIASGGFLSTTAALAAMTALSVIGCGWALGAALTQPMRRLAEDARRLADGRLGGKKLVAAEDELWGASVGFLLIEDHLEAAVLGLTEATGQIADASRALVSSSQRQEAGANEQASALGQTSSTTEELAKSARHIAQRANQVAELASRTVTAAQMGKGQADEFYSSVLKVREGNQAIADSVVRLNKRVQQIGRIVEFIDGIADKSDLLALNAELEGHKAGEVGRGFSLVAAEMRRLAESVMSSTREIGRLIDEVRDATNAAVMATEAGVKASDAGSVLAQQVSQELSRILDAAAATSDAVKAISQATHQQQLGSDQLAETMADIFKSTRAAADASKDMTTTQSDLVSLSDDLRATVGRFKVGGWS